MTKTGWGSMSGWVFARFGTVICLALLVGLAAGCSRASRRDRAVKKADQFFAAKDYQKAAIEYVNALSFDPEHPYSITQLGKVYYAQGQINRALPLLVKAQQLNPNDLGVKTQLLQLYREARAVAKARELADNILRQEPANEEALMLLAETSDGTNQMADVEKLVENLRAQGPERAVFKVIEGINSARQKDWDKTELAFKAALALDPKSAPAHRAMAGFHLMRGKVSEASRELEEEIKLDPQDLFARLRFAEFKTAAGLPQEARTILETLTQEAPDFVPAWSALATLAFDQRRFDEATTLVAKVLGQRAEDYSALLVRARLSLLKTNLAQAIREFQILAKLYDRVPQAHFELGRAYLTTNGVTEALVSLDKALTLNPNYGEALFLRGQLDLRRREYASAIKVLSQVVRQNPRLPSPQFALGEAYRASGALDDALRVYDQLASTYPTNPQPVAMRGLVLRQQQKPSEAEQAFARALELDPGYVPALNQMLELKLQKEDFSSARTIVDGFLARDPESVSAWLMRARLNLAEHATNNAEAALLKAIQCDTNSVVAYQMLARLHVESGRDMDAVANLDSILAKSPGNVPTLMRKAMILDSLGKYPQAAEVYEKILALAPQYALALNNLAYLYSDKLDKLDRAYDLASKGRQAAPNSPEMADTLGWILYRRGDYGQALTILADAAAKLPSNPEAQFHLGMVNYMLGAKKEAEASLRRALELKQDFSGADEARQRLAVLAGSLDQSDEQSLANLQKLVQAQPNDPMALMQLADLQNRKGDWNQARTSYELLLKLSPQNVPALLKLASLHAERFNEPGKAMELAKQARVAAPADLDVAQAFGRIAFQAGQHEWAASVLQECAQKKSSQPELLYDLAWALYSVGKVGDAQEQMRQAIKLNPTFTNAPQARQFLAVTGAPGGQETATQQDIAAVQAILKTEPDYVPALMVLGTSQFRQGNTNDARLTYEKALSRFPQFTPAIRALVLMPEGSSSDGRAYELSVKARKVIPGDPEVALAVGRALFKRGELVPAKVPLREATQTLATNAEAFFYLGMTQHKLGEKSQALANLERATKLDLRSDLAQQATEILIAAGVTGETSTPPDSSDLKLDDPVGTIPK